MTPYYQKTDTKLQELAQQFRDGFCYVIRGAVVSQVSIALCAKLLTDNGGHTLASEAEIQTFLDSQRLNRPAISSLDAAREAFAKLIQKDGPRAGR